MCFFSLAANVRIKNQSKLNSFQLFEFVREEFFRTKFLELSIIRYICTI